MQLNHDDRSLHVSCKRYTSFGQAVLSPSYLSTLHLASFLVEVVELTMESDHYIIDPEGDVLLVLKGSTLATGVDSVKKEPFPTTLHEEKPTEPTHADVPTGSTISVATVEYPVLENADRASTMPSSITQDTDRISDGNGEGSIEIRVSSRHLALASPFFKMKLNSEDRMVKSDGMNLVFIEVQDLDALLILLNIIHGRTSRVPRVVDLGKLCMIAGLVENCGCLEAVQVFSKIWMDNLKMTLPEDVTDSLAQWMFISWVFREEEIFKLVTGTAVRESSEPVFSAGLPIPDRILDCIEQKRQACVQKIIDSLYDRKERVLRFGNCCEACDVVLLGSLLRELHTRALYPAPLPPFANISVGYLDRTLRQMCESACDYVHGRDDNCVDAYCLLIPETIQLLNKMEERVIGLKLTDFLR